MVIAQADQHGGTAIQACRCGGVTDKLRKSLQYGWCSFVLADYSSGLKSKLWAPK